LSDTLTAPAPAAPAPGSDQVTPAAPVAAAPEGYVLAAEVETAREEGRRLAQSDYDRRLHAETERIKAEAAAAAAPAPKGDATDPGQDQAAFRTSLLRDVSGVITMSQAATSLKTEYPHADPALFAPERLSQFSSAEALRFAAEDSHRRVAAILDTERTAIETALRAELAEKFGDTGGAGGNPAPVAGDPTIQQLAAMTPAEMDALEVRSPGVIDRVKRSAGM